MTSNDIIIILLVKYYPTMPRELLTPLANIIEEFELLPRIGEEELIGSLIAWATVLLTLKRKKMTLEGILKYKVPSPAKMAAMKLDSIYPHYSALAGQSNHRPARDIRRAVYLKYSEDKTPYLVDSRSPEDVTENFVHLFDGVWIRSLGSYAIFDGVPVYVD